MKYGFIRKHSREFPVRAMCQVFDVHPSGFCAWLKNPLSKQAGEDQRQIGLIKQSWLESGCVYGYHKVHDDLRDWGESCGPNRVYRLMQLAGIKALPMAVWRRKPKPGLVIHSDQGSQYTGHEWQEFFKEHELICSMSRRGNCHDNAVAESFFQLLKRERIKPRIYPTRDEARADVLDYIEFFYNTRRRHGYNDGLSPEKYEQRESERPGSV